MNGPVPALNGFKVKSAPAASTTFLLTIIPARSTSAPRSDLLAPFLDTLAALLSECRKKRAALAHDLSARGPRRDRARDGGARWVRRVRGSHRVRRREHAA